MHKSGSQSPGPPDSMSHSHPRCWVKRVDSADVESKCLLIDIKLSALSLIFWSLLVLVPVDLSSLLIKFRLSKLSSRF